MPLTQPSDIQRVLQTAKTIAVVGYSDRPSRPSHNIANMLKRVGYEVYLVNPTLNSTPEQPIYASVADIPVKIDIVDIFRRPEAIPPVVDDAIAAKAKVIWMQLGISNDEAAQKAESAGLEVIQNRCIKVDYWNLMDGAG
jgi:predicted CoA-binding protein